MSRVSNDLRAELIVRTPAADLSRRRIPVPAGTIVRTTPGVLIKKAPCATNGEFFKQEHMPKDMHMYLAERCAVKCKD